MKVNGPEGQKGQKGIKTKRGRNSWQQAQHVWLYTDPLQTLKEERLSSVFSTDGTLISASAAPHCEAQSKEQSPAGFFCCCCFGGYSYTALPTSKRRRKKKSHHQSLCTKVEWQRVVTKTRLVEIPSSRQGNRLRLKGTEEKWLVGAKRANSAFISVIPVLR